MGAESWPASRSTGTRCPKGASKRPTWLRTQAVVLRPALPVPRLRRRARLLSRAVRVGPRRLNQPAPPKPLRRSSLQAPVERSSWSKSSRIQNIAECAPQPFTCPRSGTSRARSSGTMAGSSTPFLFPLIRRIQTTQRLISNTRSYGWSRPKLPLNSGNTTRAIKLSWVSACPLVPFIRPRKLRCRLWQCSSRRSAQCRESQTAWAAGPAGLGEGPAS